MNERNVARSDKVWERCRESKRCSRVTYRELYITKYTSIRREATWKREFKLSWHKAGPLKS